MAERHGFPFAVLLLDDRIRLNKQIGHCLHDGKVQFVLPAEMDVPGLVEEFMPWLPEEHEQQLGSRSRRPW